MSLNQRCGEKSAEERELADTKWFVLGLGATEIFVDTSYGLRPEPLSSLSRPSPYRSYPGYLHTTRGVGARQLDSVPTAVTLGFCDGTALSWCFGSHCL